MKNAVPHESAASSDWIEGPTPRKTRKNVAKQCKMRQENEDEKIKHFGISWDGDQTGLHTFTLPISYCYDSNVQRYKS